MRVLLVSTYELGHQPLHLASPATALQRAGHEVRCLDCSVVPWDDAAVSWADVVAFSVPMHTAMRLALRRAESVKTVRPELPVCLYGLYAPVSRDLTVGRLADRVIAGEYEPALVAWVDAVARGSEPTGPPGAPIRLLDRGAYSLPARYLLPPLQRYARLAVDGEERLVGYVEATHGCLHTCRHCPVPTVYEARLRAVSREVVLADVAQLVAMGARHITFGDPDFLNAPTHALRVVQAMHARWPELTFDCTTKIDHILQHARLWEGFAKAGCLFVVSAFESVNDAVLERLDKGHTTAQAVQAVRLLRAHRIEIHPSWLPFTPWTTMDDLVQLLEFVAEHDLVANTEPVMYTIRLLLPEGSLLLDHPDLVPHLGPYDPERLTYTWTAADPAVDALQVELAALVHDRVTQGASQLVTFLDVNAAVLAAAGRRHSKLRRPQLIAAGSNEGRPRLTEPWFC